MAFIGLGIIDKNLIPILFGCVICFLDRLLKYFDGGLLSKNTILTNIFASISRFLTIIPYIILKINSKRINITEPGNKNNNIIEYIYIDIKEENVKGKWGYIFLSSIIFFLQAIIFDYTFKMKTSSWILYILITPIFYYFIFKIKLYKHHYLSIILILLLGLFMDISLENIKNDITDNLLLFFMSLLREIIFSLHNVLAKYVMEKKFVSVYEYSFYNGLINIILVGIFAVIDHFFFGFQKYDGYFNDFESKEYLILLGIIFTQFFVNLSLLFTIKNNSPCHAFIMYVFGHFAYFNFSEDLIIVIICLIFILFFSLIFNEIIEINFFGLSYNTKKNIAERARRENIFAIENVTTDENSESNENENSAELINNEIYN